MKAAFAAVLFAGLAPAPQAFAQEDGPPPDAASGDPHWLSDPRNGCAIFDSDPHPGDMAAWSGACTGGRASGPGTVVYSNNGKVLQSLVGNFADGRVEDGDVTIRWGDGSSYEGGERNGAFSGQGTFVTANGDRMQGSWMDNKLNGPGTMSWANGDRYEGEWRDGQSSGQGTQTWADGRAYTGQWLNDQPNGHGVLTRKDGSRYEGEFANGKPVDASARLTASAATPAPAQLAALDPTKIGTAAAMPSPAAQVATTAGAWMGLDTLAGKKLVSVDGSTIALTVSGNSLAREIVAPNGNVERTVFSLTAGNMGTFADARDPSTPSGFFRLSDSGLDAQYADGRSESLLANGGGGVSVVSKDKSGAGFCMAWYPQGHVFSEAERKAALAEYADRLGLAAPRPAGGASSCASQQQAAARAKPVQLAATNVALDPVVVRASVVHPVGDGAGASPSASQCLSVEGDGGHWGFRNACGESVQFVYCVMGGAGSLIPCEKGAMPGSVAPKGFAALYDDGSLGMPGVDRDFRWVACQGAAGSVTAHLDQAEPPSGRCVRSPAS